LHTFDVTYHGSASCMLWIYLTKCADHVLS